MAHGLHHIHIKSKDPHASARWWVETFGGTLLPEIEFGTMRFVPVELDGVRLNITNPAPGEEDAIAEPPAIPYYGLEHIGIAEASKAVRGKTFTQSDRGHPISLAS